MESKEYREESCVKTTGQIRLLHPNYGNPDGATGVSAGGLMWNGRSASERGGG